MSDYDKLVNAVRWLLFVQDHHGQWYARSAPSAWEEKRDIRNKVERLVDYQTYKKEKEAEIRERQGWSGEGIA